MPEGRIQMLTHHTEETVWQPRWLTHPNSAIGLIDVVIAVADVEEAAQRFARFTGGAVTRTPGGAVLRLDRGGVYLVSHDRATEKLPEVPIYDAAVHYRLCAARPIARRSRGGDRSRRPRMARHRRRHRRNFSRRARRGRVVLRRARRRAAVAARDYSAGTFSASAGTTSFTAPRQPLCVRSKMMPSGILVFDLVEGVRIVVGLAGEMGGAGVGRLLGGLFEIVDPHAEMHQAVIALVEARNVAVVFQAAPH